MTAEQIAHLGLSAEDIERLIGGGCGELPVPRACELARALDGSLAWLFGCRADPRRAPASDGLLDAGAVRAAMAAHGVSHEYARTHLGLALGPWRRLLNGGDQPDLARLAALADLLQVRLDHLVRH